MWNRIVTAYPLILSIMALALSLFVAWNAGRDDPEPRTIVVDQFGERADLSTEDQIFTQIDAQQLTRILARVEDVNDQAESAANAADTILSFIEGGSILLGALIAIAVVAFGSSIQDVRSQLDDSISQAEARFDTNEARVDTIIREIQIQVQQSVAEAENRLLASEDRMKVLTGRIEDSIQETEATVANLHNMVNEAVESAKKDAEASFQVLSLLLLAEQQVRARNRKTAISTLQEAHALDPHNQTTNYLLGYLYVGRKQFDDAITHLQAALEVDPNFAPALAAMGLAQRRMGDAEKQNMKRRQLWAQAEYNLSKGLEADPSLIDADNESYFGTLGGLYRRQGRNEEALRAYEEAVQITPNNSYPVGNLATLYKKLGHDTEARNMYDRAIEISLAILDDHPGDTWARLDLAQAYLVTDQKKKSIEQYKNVIGRLTESSPLEAALSGLGFLEDAPTPIDGIGEVMQLLQGAIAQLQEASGKIKIG